MKRIIVLGTGISGLSFGWFLKEKYKDKIHLTFIEKQNRPGGLIRTVFQNDFLFELGPRGFRPSGNGLTTLELVKSLGLDHELIYANKNAKQRYLFQGGKLKRFSLWFLLKNGLVSACIKDLLSKSTVIEEESIAGFMRRKFNQKLLKNVVDPLVKGIYGGNPETLSMKSCFPHFWNLEKTHGSLIKGLFSEKKPKTKGGLAAFKKGMQTLTDQLFKKLDAEFHFSTHVHSVKQKDKMLSLETSKGDFDANFLVMAIPDCEIAKFFTMPELIYEKVSLSTVNLGWLGKQLPLTGYGFLVPSHEKKEIMGITFDSDIFPEQDRQQMTRLTAMIQNQSKDALQIALSEVQSLFHITEKPDALFCCTHESAIPQYTLGYAERLKAFKKRLPSNVYALGNSFQGVALNDCIHNAKLLAQEFSL